MIGVKEARARIYSNALSGRIVTHPLQDSTGLVLAEDIIASADTPFFDQSAMDGYAFAFDSWATHKLLRLDGEIQAGDFRDYPLPENAACRIYTGAPVPNDCDTVVMQERIILNNGFIEIVDPELKKGNNVRLKGSQTKRGTVALHEGNTLYPAGIAYLAGMGINEVKVYTKPRIHIIATGKELVNDLKDLQPGKIIESNTIGLNAALHQIHLQAELISCVDDEEQAIVSAINHSLEADILILTGGVSVGDYDLVPAALKKCGVEEIFHKVKQKPGKPFYFGKKKQTLIFGLPGNPAAVLTCFYEYVLEAINMFMHKPKVEKEQALLLHDFKKKPGLTFFLKGVQNAEGVSILGHQESYLLNSFALANCLVELNESQEEFRKGDSVLIKRIV